jgi:hypothetical protein
MPPSACSTWLKKWAAIGSDRARVLSRVKRVLLTGMLGTGKSSVVRELAACGFKAIDAYDGWSESVPDGRQMWREDGTAGHGTRRRPVRRGLREEPGAIPCAVGPHHPAERSARGSRQTAGPQD